MCLLELLLQSEKLRPTQGAAASPFFPVTQCPAITAHCEVEDDKSLSFGLHRHSFLIKTNSFTSAFLFSLLVDRTGGNSQLNLNAAPKHGVKKGEGVGDEIFMKMPASEKQGVNEDRNK